MNVDEMSMGVCERASGDASELRFGMEAAGYSGNKGDERSARIENERAGSGGATDRLDAESLPEEGFCLAGGALLEEARSVSDEGLRRGLLVQALGSSAEVVARMQNRMKSDLRRLWEDDERAGRSICGRGIDKKLLACMLEALTEDAAVLRGAVELRASIYRELGEPVAAEAVRDAYGRFVESMLAPSTDLLNRLAKRAGRKGDFGAVLSSECGAAFLKD